MIFPENVTILALLEGLKNNVGDCYQMKRILDN